MHAKTGPVVCATGPVLVSLIFEISHAACGLFCALPACVSHNADAAEEHDGSGEQGPPGIRDVSPGAR